jgi:Ca2+-transporting ATPase
MARDGLRVLGVATASAASATGELERASFRFEGLVGFLDPVRPDVPAALAVAREAGVAVVMITGDYPLTARVIAAQAGLDLSAGVMTGAEVAQASFARLREQVKRVRVFARIRPEQKLLLVEAFKANGEVVAMTGDGVNDAPALEAAHIGIAMGRRGTDVAREAADIVLLDDSFAAIVGGVRLGRRIYMNLRRALVFISAIHVPIAGLAIAPIAMGLPPMLFPVHVVLLEMVIDPVSSLVFEAEPSDEGAMRRRPRSIAEPLMGSADIAGAGLQGLLVLAATLGAYAWSLGHVSEAQARGAGFLILIAGNLMLPLASFIGAPASPFGARRLGYWSICASAGLMATALLNVDGLTTIFRLAAPPAWIVAIPLAALAGALVLLRWALIRRNPPAPRPG